MRLPVRIRGNEAEPDLHRLSIVYDLRRLAPVEGLRAALVMFSLVVASEWLRQPLLVESALAGMFACIADPGGPVRRRLPWLLGFAVAGALQTVAFSLLRAAPVPVVLPVAALWVGVLAMLRVYGQPALQLGNMLIVSLVITLDRPETLPVAISLGLAYAFGALWALLMAVLVSRIARFEPERRSVARLWDALAAEAADMRALLRDAGSGEAAWEAHARAHRRAVRLAIEAAREAVLVSSRDLASAIAPPAWVIRLEAGEQLFGALIALSDQVEASTDASLRAHADRLLRVLRPICLVLARAALSDSAVRLPRLQHGVDTLAHAAAELPGAAGVAAMRIVDLVRVGALLSVADGFLPERARILRPRLLDPLRAAMTLRAPALRLALRAALLSAVAFAVMFAYPTVYGHWLAITLILTIQPFMALTWQRALERTGGTLLGGVIAAWLSLLVTGPVSLAVAVIPLAFFCFALRPVGFGVMVTFLTPLVVVLLELGRPGTSEIEIATMRALYTLGGGLLAIAGGLLLWPSREPARLRLALEAALLAHAGFAEAAPAQATIARRAAGRATLELEASLSRALLESSRSAVRLQSALSVDAAIRRLAGLITALHLSASLPAEWGAWAGTALRTLADGREPPAPPAGADDNLARLVRQVAMIGGALARFRQTVPG